MPEEERLLPAAASAAATAARAASRAEAVGVGVGVFVVVVPAVEDGCSPTARSSAASAAWRVFERCWANIEAGAR